MFQVRSAQPSDAPALTRIARVAKAHWGYPDAWLARWRAELTVTAADLSCLTVFVAERDGFPVGFCGLDRTPQGWTLEHLWVRREAMGQGIGRRLLERAVDHVRAAGGGAIEIVSDPHAEGFYLRAGAKRVGGRDGSISGAPRTLPVLRVFV